jgi:phthiocerol/phenolphthiocerol synthesis type-I polyketide synthase E
MSGLQDAGALPILVAAEGAYEQSGTSCFHVRPGAAEDIAALLQAIETPERPIVGAIVLWDVLAGISGTPTPGYAALVALAAGLDSWDDAAPKRIVAVSAGAHSVLDEPVARPEAALLLGPAIVLPTEMPGVTIRSVDLEEAGTTNLADAARALVTEAASDDVETIVAWRRGRRWVRRYQNVSAPGAEASSLPLKPAGSYLITGGLGGIGLALAEWLADRVAARLLLTGLRPVPPRQEWDALLACPDADKRNVTIIEAIRKIEACGGEVITAAADAADPAAMSHAIDQARHRWGGIDGIIHAAGIAGSGNIAVRQDAEDIRSVLAPKLDGLSVLQELLGNTKLDFVALMSSISSVVGSPGTASYAAANAVLDAFVESSRRPVAWKLVVAINWAAWREAGMAASLVVPAALRGEREVFLRQAIATQAGVDAFARILASGRRRVVVTCDVLDGPLQRRKPAAPSGPRHQPPALANRGHLDAEITPGTETEQHLAAIWSELIGVSNIGIDDDFIELGGHSLLATRVLARISTTLGVRLSLRDIFAAPTIRQLAERVAAATAEAAETVTETSDGREEILI